MDFTEFDKHPHGTYLAVQPSGPSRLVIQKLVSEMNLKSPEDVMEYHTTVIYSKTPCPEMKYANILLPIWGVGTHLEVFPNANDGKGCVVLEIESENLQALHKRLMEEFGASYDFPSYRPHITLTYEVPDHLPEIVPINIKFDTYLVTPIKE